MKTINEVQIGETVRHTGDLTIRHDIGEDASIFIEDGSLIVEGNVSNGVKIAISLSEEMRENALEGRLLSMLSSFGGGISIGGRVTHGITIINGVRTNVGNSISANININGQHIGNVQVDGRIFTNDALTRLGHDKFEIIPASMPTNIFLSGHGASPSNAFAQATIDGVVYTGKKIHINGRQVIVEGNPEHTTSSISDEPEEEKPIQPSKLQIKGAIGSYVTINSDADIDVNTVGESCCIISKYNGVKANSIGKSTEIVSKEAINVKKVAADCKLTSQQDGIKFEELGCNVQVNVRNAITGKKIGDRCSLKSNQYGIDATNIGAQVTIDVKDAIEVDSIGPNSTLSSKQYGIKAGDVADSTTINVRDGVSLRSVGNNCNISSKQYGISVKKTVGDHSKLACRDELNIDDSVGDYTTLKSSHNQVKVYGETGSNCTIQARDTVKLRAVGDNTTISSSHDGVATRNIGSYVRVTARNDIDIDGVSPNPSSCSLVSKKGKVIKPKLAVQQPSHPSTTHAAFFKKSKDSSSHGTVSAVQDNEVPESLCCPITMDLLKEPVICILDGITYEKSAISKWLEDHRNTPSRISMQQGQKVADILIPNRAIITAVEEYESLVSPNI